MQQIEWTASLQDFERILGLPAAHIVQCISSSRLFSMWSHLMHTVLDAATFISLPLLHQSLAFSKMAWHPSHAALLPGEPLEPCSSAKVSKSWPTNHIIILIFLLLSIPVGLPFARVLLIGKGINLRSPLIDWRPSFLEHMLRPLLNPALHALLHLPAQRLCHPPCRLTT